VSREVVRGVEGSVTFVDISHEEGRGRGALQAARLAVRSPKTRRWQTDARRVGVMVARLFLP
jgi:hypothetical protein